MTKLIVIGAGGHAKVLIDALDVLGRKVLGLTDADPARRGSFVLGCLVLGDDSILDACDVDGTNLVIGIGSSALRARLFDRLGLRGMDFEAVMHPSAIVSRHARLGKGVQLLAGAIVQADAEIGVNCIVNTRAVIEHDCRVGPHCHIAPGAILAGGVVVGAGSHIGAGAVVREGIRIGAGAVVAAGSAVVRDVADGQLVKGVPARV